MLSNTVTVQSNGTAISKIKESASAVADEHADWMVSSNPNDLLFMSCMPFCRALSLRTFRPLNQVASASQPIVPPACPKFVHNLVSWELSTQENWVMKNNKRSVRKFYAVRVGRNGYKGVLNSWKECQRVVDGVPGAKFKSFVSRSEALVFAHASTDKDSWKTSSAVEKPVDSRGSPQDPDGDENTIFVYTDGACVKNGKKGSRAGVGVFFGDGSVHNISEPLEGSKQTNQRAEMTAVIRALETISSMESCSSHVTILTDSRYTRTGFCEWMPKWKRNGWKTSSGTDVLNRDLWEKLDEAAQVAMRQGFVFRIQWVRGHAGEYGNEMADQLAVEGAST